MAVQVVDLAAPPLQTEICESAKNLVVTRVWEEWLRSLVQRVQSSAATITAKSLSGQNASIGLTSLVPSASGVYRVSYRFRVTTADGVSSSLQVTIASTEGGVSCAQTSAAYTGNVTNAPQSGSFLVKVDPGFPLQFSITYASNTPGSMVYNLELRAEAV